MSFVHIADRKIGSEHPVFVIAEIGANFEHSFDKACEMIREAARCGVDAVKFQTYNPETNVTKTAPKFWDIEGTGTTQYEEQKDGLILNKKQYSQLKKIASDEGVIFFSSVCDKEGVNILEEVGVAAYKLSSMEITNIPFLKYVAAKGKTIILSTGASDQQEVEEAVGAIQSENNKNIILLHCISNYPTVAENVNLLRILELKKIFPDIAIGYSDHTLSPVTRQIINSAVALGSCAIEKHFTFDIKRAGYDHEISADYCLMKEIVDDCRLIKKALGRPQIKHHASEERVRLFGRRGAVARKPIFKGAVVTEDNIIVKRPATGIQPKEVENLLGKYAGRDIAEDEVITWDMIE